MSTAGASDRETQLVRALAAVRARIADACAEVGRDPHSVTMIAVTKTYPASDVATLVRLGVGDVGESRDQEAVAKANETAALLGRSPHSLAAPDATPRWHFVGQLQRRKARSVVTYASAVHSVDRPELVDTLAGAVSRVERPPLEVFVQVSLDRRPGRGGAAPDDVGMLADRVAAAPGLTLRGVMAVAPLDAEPTEAFARLGGISQQVRVRHPAADAISAGMSGDLEAAIASGATHVRVGTALLGRRPPPIG